MRHFRRPPLFVCLSLAAIPAVAMDDPFDVNAELPTVLTATRLRQAPAEVPGSMTVIDRDLIRASGARDVPELLRLVPGMKVGYLSGHRPNVNYHGTNISEARRMQVLVDGRSVYRPGLATVDWNDIPLAIEDIERIEVFRGPNTAAYGANALMGVINIISVAPDNYHGTRLKVTEGKRGVRDLYGSQAFTYGATHARLSLFAKEDDGFDLDQFGRERRDDRRLNAFTFASSTELMPNRVMDWQFGAKEGSNQAANAYSPFAPGRNRAFAYDEAMLEHRATSDISARDYFARVHLKQDISERHQLELKAYAQHMERLREWRACDSPVVFSPELRQIYEASNVYPRRINSGLRGNAFWSNPTNLLALVGPELFPAVESVLAQHAAARNGAPACWDINENLRETRYEVEAQNTLQITDSLRSVLGVNLRHDRTSSKTFFDGAVTNHIGQLFGNLEYRPHHRWLLHAGAMAEEDRLSGFSFSPRLAAQFFVRPTHSLRAVYSEAVRSPDMYENNARWTYTANNLSGPVSGSDKYYALAKGPGNLKQEQMRSGELGYNGYFHHLGLAIDIKAFHDEIHDMISEPLQVVNFVPSNDNFARFKGGEGQLDWRVTSADRLRLTYAYVDFVATRVQDQRLTARHSGSAAWIHQWPGKIESSVIYYGADTLNERRFERLDGRLAKTFAIGASRAILGLTWQRRLDDEALTWTENLYDKRDHYYLSAELSF
jgi:iron complex outermembrane recepter protein